MRVYLMTVDSYNFLLESCRRILESCADKQEQFP